MKAKAAVQRYYFVAGSWNQLIEGRNRIKKESEFGRKFNSFLCRVVCCNVNGGVTVFLQVLHVYQMISERVLCLVHNNLFKYSSSGSLLLHVLLSFPPFMNI